MEKTFKNTKERTYDNIQEIANVWENEYLTICLLNHNYFKDHYKIIITYLSKQQAVDVDQKDIHQINILKK